MRRSITWPLALALVAVGAAPARAQDDISQFYAGKTLRIVVGVAVGSGYDLTARLLGRHIANHIPGKPQVVVSNQTGAGGLTMTQALYTQGPKDGTAIGAPFNGTPTMPYLTPETARFDPTKLNWIGSTNRESQVSYVWHTAPHQSLADIARIEFVAGSQAPGSTQHDFPVAVNRLFGMKFKVINGYDGTPKIHLAMERGEVHGLASTNWTTLKAIAPDWLAEKKVRLLGQWGFKPHAELTDVPMWLDLAKTDADKQAMQVLLARLEFGRPYFLPPDVPAARVEAIRRAFDATMKDPAFLVEAEKAKLEIEPLTGEEVARLVGRIAATPPAVLARVREALEVK